MAVSSEMNELYKTIHHLIKTNPILSRAEEIFYFSKIYLLRKKQLRIMLLENDVMNYFFDRVKLALDLSRSDSIFSYTPDIWANNYEEFNSEMLAILDSKDMYRILECIDKHNVNHLLYDELFGIYSDLNIKDLEYQIIHNYEKRIKTRLVNSNLRLVLDVLLKAKNCKFLTKQDLFQEGVIAIERSIRNYDLSAGVKFSTHSYNWIYAKITRAIDEDDNVIAIPVNRSESRREINKASSKFLQIFGYEPNEDELKEFNPKLKDIDINSIISHNESEIIGLDDNIKNGWSHHNAEPKKVEEVIADERILDEADVLLRKQITELVNKEIDGLDNPFQEYVVRSMFGINDTGDRLKNVEIMEDLSITNSEFASLKKKTFKKLKNSLSRSKVVKEWEELPSEWSQGFNQN